jgi:acyl carrier protein
MGLDSVELIVGLENRFDVTLSDDEAARIRTISDLRDAIARKTDLYTAGEIYEAIVQALLDDFAVDPAAIAPNAEIARDLGID